jgi:hypothetical protein
MKHLSEKKRKSISEPLKNVFPEINKILEQNGMQDYRVQEFTLTRNNNHLICPPGFHQETYCDRLGRCYEICVRDY